MEKGMESSHVFGEGEKLIELSLFFLVKILALTGEQPASGLRGDGLRPLFA